MTHLNTVSTFSPRHCAQFGSQANSYKIITDTTETFCAHPASIQSAPEVLNVIRFAIIAVISCEDLAGETREET